MSENGERRRRDEPVPGLAELRQVEPPPSLVPAVMRRIAEPAPLGWWGWLRTRHRFELRLSASPLGLGASALAIGLLIVVALRSPAQHGRVTALPQSAPIASVPRLEPEPQAKVQDEREAVVVRFVYTPAGGAQTARAVAVAGDFNGWDPERTPLHPSGSGAFAATVRLPAGTHEYMLVVDGQWVTDPAAAERRPDGFGRENAVLRL